MPVANRDPDVRHPILLPAPQRLRRERGGHRLSPGRLIQVAGGDRAALLRIGTAVRDALAEAGASWQLTAHGGSGAEIGATVAVDPARVSRAQGYLLAVGRERIEIVGHDEAGAFYGAMTLRQIARQARDGVLACVRIADYPDVVHRGVMLDISRDRVPAMETLYGLVDLLSEWKVNQLQLYTEHTFAYRNHREVWADWSPMTGEQVMELDAYCRDRYVELVPNQNTFGHLARWMVHPRYRPLCEDDDPAVFHPHRGLYGTLCPTDPGSIALVDELLEELLPHFTSRQVHIGCDEARIGLARSRRVVEERGAGPVYLDYVRQVHELVRRRGRTTQLWGDVLINHAELASEFPAGAIPVMENYAADAPFDTYADTCVQAGLPFYLSSGINCWSTIIGNTATALANIRRAGESAVRHGAAGVLNTHWGDNGHWQHLPVAFPGYAYGAAMGWAPAANADLDLPAALDAHAFRDAAGVMGRLVCDLGDVSRCHDALAGSHGPLPAWILIGLPGVVEQLAGLTEEALGMAEDRLEQVMAPLDAARMDRPDAETIAAELRNGAGLYRHALHLWAARIRAHGTAVAKRELSSDAEVWPRRTIDAEYAALPAPARAALEAELASVVDDFRRLWLRRDRPGGLHDSTGRFERLLAAYRGDDS